VARISKGHADEQRKCSERDKEIETLSDENKMLRAQLAAIVESQEQFLASLCVDQQGITHTVSSLLTSGSVRTDTSSYEAVSLLAELTVIQKQQALLRANTPLNRHESIVESLAAASPKEQHHDLELHSQQEASPQRQRQRQGQLSTVHPQQHQRIDLDRLLKLQHDSQLQRRHDFNLPQRQSQLQQEQTVQPLQQAQLQLNQQVQLQQNLPLLQRLGQQRNFTGTNR
jgi:hypothetical protein